MQVGMGEDNWGILQQPAAPWVMMFLRVQTWRSGEVGKAFAKRCIVGESSTWILGLEDDAHQHCLKVG